MIRPAFAEASGEQNGAEEVREHGGGGGDPVRDCSRLRTPGRLRL